MSEPVHIAVVDYGMGNVRSVQNALERLGARATITFSPEKLREADGLVLPGVGAFGQAMHNLVERDLVSILNELVLERRKPILGICLGMQLFASSSEEMGTHQGLGWIPGVVVRAEVERFGLALPHVGWNDITVRDGDPLFARVGTGTHFYFDHSFHYRAEPSDVVATVEYGSPLIAAIRRGVVIGVQFHPEKSQSAGLKLLRNYLNLVAANRSNGAPAC